MKDEGVYEQAANTCMWNTTLRKMISPHILVFGSTILAGPHSGVEMWIGTALMSPGIATQSQDTPSHCMNAPAKLSELPAGASAIIEELANGISALTRLRELGLVPGTKVKIVRRAPLGEPIEIALRGSRIAMRNKDAEAIAISPLIWK